MRRKAVRMWALYSPRARKPYVVYQSEKTATYFRCYHDTVREVEIRPARKAKAKRRSRAGGSR